MALGGKLIQQGDLDHPGVTLLNTTTSLEREIARLDHLTQCLKCLREIGLDANIAVMLLRMYAGPAAQFAMRTAVATDEAACKYDTAVAEAYTVLISRHIDPNSRRLWPPWRMGGYSALSCRARAADAAWMGWHDALPAPAVAEAMNLRSLEYLLVACPVARRVAEELRGRLAALGARLRCLRSHLTMPSACPPACVIL